MATTATQTCGVAAEESILPPSVKVASGVTPKVTATKTSDSRRNTSSLSDALLGRLRDFWTDLKIRIFLPIKVLNFIVYGGMMALYPFLPLQARSLGITESELGIVYAILPLFSLVGPPVAGMIADKIGNFKYFLAVMVFASGLASLLYMAVPVGRIHHKMPDVLPVQLSCSGTSSLPRLTTLNKLKCEYEDVAGPVDVIVSSCTSECELAQSALKDISFSKNVRVKLESEPKTTSAFIERVAQAIPTTNFDPGAIYEVFQAELQGARVNRALTLTQNICPSLNERLTLWVAQDHELPSHSNNDPVLPMREVLGVNSSSSFKSSDAEATEIMSRQPAKLQSATECSARCRVLVLRKGLCKNEVSVESINPQLTFWVYLLVRVINSITLVMSMPLIEGAIMATLKEYDGDFGFQRMYGSAGPLIVTPITGALIDAVSSYTNSQDYRPAFFVYFAVKLISCCIILMMNLKFKKPSKRVMKDFKSTITSCEICCFLLMSFFAGVCYGALDTFLFWLLQDMGGTKSMMGLTLTVGNLCSLPILLFASPIISTLGSVNTIILGFGVYVIRYIGYSLIHNPWLCLPFEALECFTMALLLTATMTYSAELSTPTTTATIQGMAGGLYHGVGQGAGGITGGFMITAIGVRRTFQVMAVVTSVATALYFNINKTFFSHKALERKLKACDAKNKKNSPFCKSTALAETFQNDEETEDGSRSRKYNECI